MSGCRDDLAHQFIGKCVSSLARLQEVDADRVPWLIGEFTSKFVGKVRGFLLDEDDSVWKHVLLVAFSKEASELFVSIDNVSAAGGFPVLLYLKNKRRIDPTVDLEHQISCTVLSDEVVLKAVTFLINNGFSHATELMEQQGSQANATERETKLRELAFSLKRADRSLVAPDLIAETHHKIKEIVARGAHEDDYRRFFDSEQLQEPSFLNALQSTANEWLKSIQRICSTERDIKDGSVFEEVHFWASLQDALVAVARQLQSPEICITIHILISAKRWHNIAGLASDSGLNDKLQTVREFSQFLSSIPLKMLESSDSMEGVSKAMDSVAAALKKFRFTNYPAERFAIFLEHISREVQHVILTVSPNLFTVPFTSFSDYESEILRAIDQWESIIEDCRIHLREVVRRRRALGALTTHVRPCTNSLRESVNELATFRKRHYLLSEALNTVGYIDHPRDLEFLYEPMNGLSNYSMDEWTDARAVYSQRLTLIEDKLITLWKDALEQKKSSAEIIDQYSSFALLMTYSPRLTSTMKDCQKELLDSVKRELILFREKINEKDQVEQTMMLKNVSSVSATLIARSQLRDRTRQLYRRCEMLLGHNWEKLPEGKLFSPIFRDIRQKTDCESLFERWKSEITDSETGVSQGPILKIVHDQNQTIVLSVNFEPFQGNLFDEVKTFVFLGFDMPSKLIRLADKHENARLSAVSALEQVQTFLSVVQELKHRHFTAFLVEHSVKDIWDLILRAALTPWSAFGAGREIGDFEPAEIIANDITKQLETAVSSLLARLLQSERIEERLKELLRQLSSSPCEDGSLSQIVSSFQLVVSETEAAQRPGMEKLVQLLNNSIEEVLTVKIRRHLDDLTSNIQTILISNEAEKLVFTPCIKELKAQWLSTLEDTVTRIALPKISLENPPSGRGAHFELSHLLKDDIIRALKTTENKSLCAMNQLERLRIVEFLNGVHESDVVKYVKGDINICLDLLVHLIESHSQVKESKFRKNGELLLRFTSVEFHLSLTRKLDYWCKVLSQLLLELYTVEAVKLKHDLKRHLGDLEEQSLSSFTFENMYCLLTAVQVVEHSMPLYCQLLETFSVCEIIFRKLHLKLPHKHVFLDQLWNDEMALRKRLEEVLVFIESKREIFVDLLDREEASLRNRSDSLLNDWQMKKQHLSTVTSTNALLMIKTLRQSFNSMSETIKRLEISSRVLAHPLIAKYYLKSALDDLDQLESAYRHLNNLQGSLESFLQRSWISINISDIQEELKRQKDGINTLMKQAFQHAELVELSNLIQDIERKTPLLKDLRDPAFSNRHWDMFFADSRTSRSPTNSPALKSFCLQDVIDLTSEANTKIILGIICDAQREAALGKSLDRIRISWEDARYETFQHPSGMMLVSNWNYLQQACLEDLEELMAMKKSSFYGHLEQNCLELELKIAAFSALLPDWIDLQFHWLDLFGTLGEKGVLLALLPSESAKFSDLTADLEEILHKIFRLPNLLDILHIPECDVLFKQMLNRVRMIESLLGGFLEQQRALFPRFHFLGNRDLLGLLGAGSDLSQVSCYLSKLFDSIADLRVDNRSIKGIYSSEGEFLELSNPITVEDKEGPPEWLTALDLEIKNTLSENVGLCLAAVAEEGNFLAVLDSHIFQVLLLAWQIYWTAEVEKCFNTHSFWTLQTSIEDAIDSLSRRLQGAQVFHEKQKIRSLITELIYSSRTVTELLEARTEASKSAIWQKTQKFYYIRGNSGSDRNVLMKQCSSTLTYSFNYIGVPERLIYTPTMEEAFAALGEAVSRAFGGCLFGPAGTGKTETIKALAQNLGKMVLVFNCDDSFDFPAISRLIVGVAQIGAWACFDEFNRLDENVLSSVTGHIETIQDALSRKSHKMEIMGRSVPLSFDTGLFITLNPGYEGRSYLPQTLKRKFREYSMTRSEVLLISQVILRVQGFKEPETSAQGLVELFKSLKEACSSQKHYDFGLRSVKKVVQHCATLMKHDGTNEKTLFNESLAQTILPGLSPSDEAIYSRKVVKTFPFHTEPTLAGSFTAHLFEACDKEWVTASECFLKKCRQLYHLQKTQQAIIIMGDAGVGKTAVWKATLRAMRELDGHDNIVHVIDSKTMGKGSLYGRMNKATLEWKDGIFTSIVRTVNGDSTGTYANARVWIVLDSELDPDYIETLNSALDDNKLLTLPTGERIPISHKIRLILEVTNLEHATAATMTRCSILWLADPVYSAHDQLNGILAKEVEDTQVHSSAPSSLIEGLKSTVSGLLAANRLQSLISKAEYFGHIMGFQKSKLIPMLVTGLFNDIRTNHRTLDMLTSKEQVKYMNFRLYHLLLSVIASDISPVDQDYVASYLRTLFVEQCDLLTENAHLETVMIINGAVKYVSLTEIVEQQKVEPHIGSKANVVIPTVDTIRYELFINELLKIKQPIILCGPPGSGKTMLINSIISREKKYQLVSMNFSKSTTVTHIFKCLNRHMKYVDGPKGLTLCPKDSTKALVLFCDEINLPKPDKYGAQTVILFLRLLVEKGGFWREADNKWIHLERLHVIGACNPSTDPGRTHLPARILRHIAILFIDHPGRTALSMIYKPLFSESLILAPCSNMSGICEASISVYIRCQKTFTADLQPHYMFSPRELTRWVRGMHSAIAGRNATFSFILRIWAYEAKRIFADRLVTEEDKVEFYALLTETVNEFFPEHRALVGDTSCLLFSSWLSEDYNEVCSADLLAFLKQKMRIFCEEEGLKSLLIHNEMLDHVVSIDRVLNQIQGHCMLVGAGRTGKTTMIRFVCWLNHIHFLRPNMHRTYGIADFDHFLRDVLLRCTVHDQKMCLVIDESNIMETAFLERMNTLLANSDIPDLFQDEQYEILISSLKQRFDSFGYSNCNEQDLYNWFTKKISKNLHVVFTMCDSFNYDSSQLISSPALLNRCVIKWIGTWSQSTLSQLTQEILKANPELSSYDHDNCFIRMHLSDEHRESLSDIFLLFYDYLRSRYGCISPGFLLDAVSLFLSLYEQKCDEMENDKRFLLNGLAKLKEAVVSFGDLTRTLERSEAELQSKELEAKETLNKILCEQNEAEQRHEATRQVQVTLTEREREVRENRDSIQLDLKNFEPVMQAAQLGVKNIKKQHLTEIRSMANPPLTVKVTLEALCSVLGHQSSEWRSIQQFIRSDEFILNILHFDAETQLTKEALSLIEDKFLSMPEFSFEKVHRASKACGPLFKWVVAQIRFGELLEKVEPLRLKARKLKDEALLAKSAVLAAEDMSRELEDNIKQMKNNYMLIFRDMEHIRSGMDTVRKKLDRSKKLIGSLSAERSRWEQSVESFQQKASNITGNCLISSIVFTYFGQMDEKQRASALEKITSILRESDLEHDSPYDFVHETMSTESQHAWFAHGLSNESLSNFIMILASNVVPYIIDPSSNVPKVLLRQYGTDLETLSFLDPGFIRKFVNAIKFGNMLLITNADQFDPIISNVITCVAENSRVARIGDTDVSVSSDLRLFLHSNEFKKPLPSFLKSRVRVVNFSTTSGTIEMQAIELALKYEAPKIELERQASSKMNADYELRLKALEGQILSKLNESKGSILENDDLIEALEEVKAEASEISVKLKNNRKLIEKLTDFSAVYSTFALHCTSIYSIIERFGRIHWFYEIPIWQFFGSLEDALQSRLELSQAERDDGLKSLIEIAYQKLYLHFSSYFSIADREKLAFILHLMHCHNSKTEVLRKSFRFLLELLEDGDANIDESDIPEGLKELGDLVRENKYETAMEWVKKEFTSGISIEQLSSSKVRRSILIATDKGSDCSPEVIRIARSLSQNLSIISLGSLESTNYAEQEIARCISEGSWILLQNIQMSMPWVQSYLAKKIEQQLEYMDVWEKDFKIFMSCNFLGDALPSTLLQQSYKVTIEGTPTVLRLVKNLWKSLPIESREGSNSLLVLNFLLAWFHAILDARSRLVPVGFKKRYDFDDCDYRSGLECIANTAHINPGATPSICEQIHYNLGRIIYGGKVDDDEDLHTLQDICRSLFQPAAVECLADVDRPYELLPGLLIPQGPVTYKHFSDSLDQASEPTEYYTLWLGLPEEAIYRFDFNMIRDTVKGAIEVLQ